METVQILLDFLRILCYNNSQKLLLYLKGLRFMYCVKKMTEDLYWVGASERRLNLFENACTTHERRELQFLSAA